MPVLDTRCGAGFLSKGRADKTNYSTGYGRCIEGRERERYPAQHIRTRERDTHMTWGYIIGTAVAILLGLVCISILLASLLFGLDDDGPFWPGVAGGIAGLLIVATVWVIATFPPFETKYHSYRTVSGVVEAIQPRLLADGNGGTTQNYPVTIGGQDYRCDDSRCALVHVGDTLTLQCIGEFELHGASGYDCNFVSVKAAKP